MADIEKIIPDGARVMLVSAAAYVGCYLYAASYAAYFGVPREFVSVSIQTLVLFGSVIALACALAYQVLEIIVTVSRDGYLSGEDSPIPLLAKKWGFLVLLGVTFWFVSGYEVDRLWTLWYPIIFLSFDLVIPMFRPKGESYGRALKEWLALDFTREAESEKKRPAFLGDPTFKKFFATMLLLFLSVCFCLALGRGEARRRETFGLVGSEVVLGRYGDSLILCRYDSKTNTLFRDYHVVSAATLTERITSRKLVGVRVQGE